MSIKQSMAQYWEKKQNEAGFKSALLTLFALLVLLLFWVPIDEIQQEKLLTEQRHMIEEDLEACSISFTDVLHQRFIMLNALEAYVKTQLNYGYDFSNFDFYASVVHSTVPGIRNLAIAPGGINRYVYPLTDNEAVVDHDLIHDQRPEVREDVQTAIRTGQAIVSGPYELRQKGQGIILRKAIYHEEQFWGLVTIAVDMEPIYAAAGLNNTSELMSCAFRRGQDVFYGPAAVFASEPAIQAVKMENAYLELAAIPFGGWDNAVRSRLTTLRLTTLLIILLLLIITYLFSYRNATIKALVSRKTEELSLAKGFLEEELRARERLESDLLKLSRHDYLTGLHNRGYFEEALKSWDRAENLPLTIIMADVNGLKLINDAFGLAAGDKLLRRIGKILQKEFREYDLLARTGGDEFVILLRKTSMEEAESIVCKIKQIFAKVTAEAIEISLSFGCETKQEMAEDIHEVLKKAENNMYRQKLFDRPSMRGETINAILGTLHEKNKREEKHSQRVSVICEAIGHALKMPVKEINELKTVGLLHDIGKVAIEEAILNKSGKLSDEEWLEIRRHPEIGYRILSSVKDMGDLAEYVLAHHERWDGLGYPRGLKGEEIPLQARIIALADAYDAMTSERTYREAMSQEMAVQELQKHSGTQFDPYLSKIFISEIQNKDCQI